MNIRRLLTLVINKIGDYFAGIIAGLVVITAIEVSNSLGSTTALLIIYNLQKLDTVVRIITDIFWWISFVTALISGAVRWVRNQWPPGYF